MALRTRFLTALTQSCRDISAARCDISRIFAPSFLARRVGRHSRQATLIARELRDTRRMNSEDVGKNSTTAANVFGLKHVHVATKKKLN
jgi:hypothetical protein